MKSSSTIDSGSHGTCVLRASTNGTSNDAAADRGSATPCRADDYVHLRPLRTSGTRPPLICVFPGSPGARDMAKSLPEDQPVYEFYWPNIDGQTNFPTVEELAVTFIRDVKKLQAHGPYQLCGYSQGGLVAYEMARLLLSQGEDVSFVAAFDTWHPKFLQNLKFRELAKYRMTRIVERLQKYGWALIQGRFDDFGAFAREFIETKVRLVGWRAARFSFRMANRPVPKAMQSAAAFVSLQNYSPKPLTARLVLVRAEKWREKILKDKAAGWHTCAKGGVDVHFVSAPHGAMVHEPYVHGLVERIAPYLAREWTPIDREGA